MTNEDDPIREALWPEAEAEADPRFAAAVLFRLGRRRRMLRHAWRILVVAGTAGSAAVLAEPLVGALQPLRASIDPAVLAGGLLLLLVCAVVAPSRV